MRRSFKVISLALALTLAIGTTAGMTAMAAAESGGTTPQSGAQPIAETTASTQVYLVPGEGNSLEGTPITAEETAALHMEGEVFKAGATGTALPTPTTTKKDQNDVLFTFNGWWTIVDAEVTYFETVPAVEEITYLYADFRAALSQPRDPVAPSGGTATSTPEHYMRVTRAASGEVELIPLHVSGTDVSNAEQAGLGGPVQWYNEWFVLEPGDTISYWFSGVYGNQPMYGPRPRHNPQSCDILFNSSGKYGNTSAYVVWANDDYDINDPYSTRLDRGKFYKANAADEAPLLSYTGNLATQAYIFRIYIQFYDEGGHMTLFMENLSLKLGVEA